MVFGTLIFLSILSLTVWNGWKEQENIEIRLAQQRVNELSLRLQAIIKAADDEVSQLVDWAENFVEHAPYPGSHILQTAVTNAIESSDDESFTLDDLSLLPESDRLGQMLGLVSINDPVTPQGVSHLDLAISMLDRMGDGQKTSRFLRWNYFFAANEDLLAISPWASSKDLLGGEQSIRTFLHKSWLDYEVTKKGLPINNPKRSSYWTEAYVDQVGTGLMVSHGKPIYWGDHFVGVAATDVLLNFLNEILASFPDMDGKLLIANEYDQVLTHRSQFQSEDNSIPTLQSLLAPEINITTTPVVQYNGQWVKDNFVITKQINNPQWTILFLLPKTVITARIIDAFYYQLILAIVLIVSAIVVNLIFWRLYVSPTLNVANYVMVLPTKSRHLVMRIFARTLPG